MALATSHPIFIIDNASEEMTNKQKSITDGSSVDCGEDNVTEEMRKDYYSSDKYQINKRYENSGKSEFCVVSTIIDEEGHSYWLDNSAGWYLIGKVKKKEIGTLLRNNRVFCRPNTAALTDIVPFECNYVFWNTFERDWAKSPKNLGDATANGCTIYLAGNMKSNSNWYAYHPDAVQNNPLDLMGIFINGMKWHDNALGKFQIWRTYCSNNGSNTITVTTRR